MAALRACVGLLPRSSAAASTLIRAAPCIARAEARYAPAAGSGKRTSTLHPPAIRIEFDGVKQSRVEDVTVNITFVNYAGERTTLPGRVGESLFDLARRYSYAFVDAGCGGGGTPQDVLHKDGMWYEPKYGEGAACSFCHVIIPQSHYPKLAPKRPDEIAQLETYPFPEDMTNTSRLACQVKLSDDMNGMVVYIPDGPPSDIP